MRNSQAPTAPCKLCGNVAVLQRSHIVSRWCFRRIVNTPAGSRNPVQVDEGIAMLSSKQPAEYMLCDACEELIALREKYVSTITVDAAGTFPALQQTRVIEVHDWEWKTGDASALDCDAIAYFAASVIWRASVSSYYANITLGPHAAAFADYLQGRAGFPNHAALIVEFMQPRNGPRLDRVIVHPDAQQEVGYHLHQFALLGMVFRLLVGNVLPAWLKSFSFVDQKVVILSNGTNVLTSLAARAKAATPKGSLARRP